MASSTLAEKTITGFQNNSTYGCYCSFFEAELVILNNYKYAVTWDGILYVKTAQNVTFIGDTTARIIGNASLLQLGDNTGEPFCIVYYYANGYRNGFATNSTASSHTVAVRFATAEDEEAVGGGGEEELSNVLLKDRDGNAVTYEGVQQVKLKTDDGGYKTFISGEATDETVELDFSDGDMVLTPDDGKLWSKMSIPKPENLLSENIAEGVNIAGIIGSLIAGSGGSDVLIKGGSFTGGTTSSTITHGLGVVPDVLIAFRTARSAASSYTVLDLVGFSTAFGDLLGIGLYFSYHVSYRSANLGFAYGTSKGIEQLSSTAVVSVNANTFTLGNSSYKLNGSSYYWIAIGGLT